MTEQKRFGNSVHTVEIRCAGDVWIVFGRFLEVVILAKVWALGGGLVVQACVVCGGEGSHFGAPGLVHRVK